MSKETQNIFKTSSELDRVPNAPYFPSAISHEIKRRIESFSSFNIEEDALAIYAHYENGSTSNKLVIDTHLDHPAIAFDGQNLITLGSLFPEILSNLNENLSFPVIIFDAEGKEIAQEIVNYNLKTHKAEFSENADNVKKNLPKNSQVIPWIEGKTENDQVHMRSADNLSVTSVAIHLMEWIEREKPEGNITVIFTKLEEIRQASAVGIAKNNGTPFGEFDDSTFIVVLEAASVGQTSQSKSVIDKPASYEKGVVIRIADSELAYQIGDTPNLAEALVLHASENINYETQHSPLVSNCNATAYVLFSSCPNIICLTIPCKNKHNFNENGDFVPEKIYYQDMESLYELLCQIVILSGDLVNSHPEQILTGEVNFPGNSDKNIKKKRKELTGAYQWIKPRLQSEHLSPENLSERARFFEGRIKSLLSTE